MDPSEVEDGRGPDEDDGNGDDKDVVSGVGREGEGFTTGTLDWV